MNLWKSPWKIFHGRPASLRRQRASAGSFRLDLEILEDRLVLSSSPTGPQPVVAYANWRNETFSIENTQVSGPAGLQLPGGGPGEGFGQDIDLPQVLANYPYRGAGYSVAVIDTGIDYNNPALGGGWGKRVIAGYNFVNNTSDPMDDNGHGTHVAGIIGSSDATYTGEATGVNFIALKVLDASGSGTFGAVDLALQWVAAHQAQYNIVAVNMSLGSGNYTIDPFPYLESDFTALKNEGVFIAVAAGNSFYTVNSAPGLAYPAVSPLVVSVGAVWDGNFGPVSWLSGARDNTTATDQITSFTQRSSALDILAPGAMITSTYLNDTFEQMAGTSMATPVITGAAVLIHQALVAHGAAADANQDYILHLMQTTGVTIVDNDFAADNVTNTGLSFKRLNLFAALNAIGPVNVKPPTLSAITNQTMTAGDPVVITLTASDPNGFGLTYSAMAQAIVNSTAYKLGQQLGLSYAGSYFLNSIGQNEKWLLGDNNQWYCLMPNGDLRSWQGSASATLAAAALVGNVGVAVYDDPTQLWTAPASSPPPVTLTTSGNQLTVQCSPSYLGTFQVTVTATNGYASASQSFNVDVDNRAPVQEAIANQSIQHSQKTLTISLNGSDPDDDPLTWSAAVLPPSAQAYSLEQSLRLTYTGNYWTNYYGQQEKWLLAGTTWYCLLPDGELRLAGSSAASMMAASSLVATLNSSFYQDPSLLWNAQPPVAAPITFSFSGNQMTITPAPSFVGSSVIQVALSDGKVSVQQTFQFTVTDSPPVVSGVGSQIVVHGRSLTLTVATSDADGDALSLTPHTVAPSQQAISLEKSLGLSYTGNYWTNYYGQGEKWLLGGTTWYCVLPNGQIRLAGTNVASMMASGSLVATFDSNYYLDPSLIWNATNYVVPQVIYSLSGNQLTVTPAASFVGTFLVSLTASDGAMSVQQAFAVTATNTAPVFGPIANQSIAPRQTSLSLKLAASDADGDSLTYSAQALSLGQLAYHLKQSLGLTYTGNYWTNYYGQQEKWLLAGTTWYCLLPDGELRLAGSSAAAMLAPGALVATLDSSFYQNPALLYNAQPGTAIAASVTVTGNQLTIQPPLDFFGTFSVEVSVTDGAATTTQTFTVLVNVTNN